MRQDVAFFHRVPSRKATNGGNGPVVTIVRRMAAASASRTRPARRAHATAQRGDRIPSADSRRAGSGRRGSPRRKDARRVPDAVAATLHVVAVVRVATADRAPVPGRLPPTVDAVHGCRDQSHPRPALRTDFLGRVASRQAGGDAMESRLPVVVTLHVDAGLVAANGSPFPLPASSGTRRRHSPDPPGESARPGSACAGSAIPRGNVSND